MSSEGDPTAWSAEEVADWLAGMNLKVGREALVENGVSGAMLADVDDDVLREDLGITSRILRSSPFFI